MQALFFPEGHELVSRCVRDMTFYIREELSTRRRFGRRRDRNKWAKGTFDRMSKRDNFLFVHYAPKPPPYKRLNPTASLPTLHPASHPPYIRHRHISASLNRPN